MTKLIGVFSACAKAHKK